MDQSTDPSSTSIETLNKKRRHPESSSSSTPSSLQRPSLDVLQLIEHPNFDELARWNPMFQRAWEATRQQQKETQKTFSACVSQEFTIALTRALLKTHFQLELPHLEDHHLCPPVPNRFYYLHWIHTELLGNTTVAAAATTAAASSSRPCLGMDIGSGATAIYSLLAAKFFQWHMFTTEIDVDAATMAQNNVQANHLSSYIQVALVSPTHSQDPSQPLGGPLERSIMSLEQYLAQQQQNHSTSTTTMLDFVMTNPPFYDQESTMTVESHKHPRVGDGRARTSMTVSEGYYPGGEIGFVTEMIVDCLRRPHLAQWYSSMVGKKSSLQHLHKLLVHTLGPAHVRVTEYGPGQYTRWFLAWTLQRPTALDPNARIKMTLPSQGSDWFPVTISSEATNHHSPPLAELIARIMAFGQSSPGGWNLSTTLLASTATSALIQLQETNPVPIALFVDESDPHVQTFIPRTLLEGLQGYSHRSWLLPPEGHFVIQIAITATTQTVTTTSSPNNNSVWHVQLTGYRHSLRGQTAIKKIFSTIEGEIRRTNRQWRRKLQRQTQTTTNEDDHGNADCEKMDLAG